MPDSSANLSLPLLLPAQAQKHVTHNEALLVLDALVQLVVLDRTLTTPPATPAEGDRHIVPAGPTGWGGPAGSIATRVQGAWIYHVPRPGWQAHVLAETRDLIWQGGAWADPALRAATLGINTAADSTNRLAVSAPATLFTHEGAGHQVKVNKAAAGQTASLLFQNAFSGRAEIGLAGGDDLSVKVSATGATWTTALVAEAATGRVHLPAGLEVTGTATATGPLTVTGTTTLAATATGNLAVTGTTALTGPATVNGALTVTGATTLGATATAGLAVTGLLSGTAVTQTPTDATAGRLLKVGDSATLLAGGFALRVTRGGTANALTLTTGAGIGGTPPTGLMLRFRAGAVNTGAATIALDGGSAFACRTIVNVALPADYIRTDADTVALFDGSVWILDRQIERGSNANGSYVRFADGMQRCTSIAFTADATTAVGSSWKWAANQVWTYPIAFISNPVVSPGNTNNTALVAATATTTVADVNFNVISTVSATGRSANAVANGRWY